MSATAELSLPLPTKPDRPPPSPVRPAGSIFLPKEHGSWSLALEPLALGLWIAPSWAGGAFAAAALAGFFARRPLKAALDRMNSPRRAVARKTLLMWSTLAAAGGIEAAMLAPWSAFWPLLPAAVLGGIFVWFDAQGDSRAAAAEVAGSAAFAFLPAALATLAGLPAVTALALAALALARSVPAVLVVRTCLRRAKGAFAARSVPLQVSAAACAVSVGMAAAGLAPGTAGILAGLLFARSLWLLGPCPPAWPAKRLGMMEGLLGLFYVAFLAATWPTGGIAGL